MPEVAPWSCRLTIEVNSRGPGLCEEGVGKGPSRVSLEVEAIELAE